MNKQELISAVSLSLNSTKEQASTALDAVLENIQTGLAKDGEVRLQGFGSFRAHTSKPRSGRNPKTGDAIEIPARTSAKFKASASLNDAL